jgi:hypothetical protein
MATGNWQVYDSAKVYLGDGTIDFNTNTLAVALVASTYTFALTHTIYSNLTNELSTAFGYTAGGATVTGSVSAVPAGSTPAYAITAAAWTASGGSIVARRAVLYVNATVNTIVKPLIASFLLDAAPADVTVTTGNTLTITAGTVFTIGGATT